MKRTRNEERALTTCYRTNDHHPILSIPGHGTRNATTTGSATGDAPRCGRASVERHSHYRLTANSRAASSRPIIPRRVRFASLREACAHDPAVLLPCVVSGRLLHELNFERSFENFTHPLRGQGRARRACLVVFTAGACRDSLFNNQPHLPMMR